MSTESETETCNDTQDQDLDLFVAISEAYATETQGGRRPTLRSIALKFGVSLLKVRVALAMTNTEIRRGGRPGRVWDLESLKSLCDIRPEEEGGCWLWTGALDKAGYGCITWRGKSTRVHRVAFIMSLEDGETPLEDRVPVIHTCHEARCARPDHLISGADVQRDVVSLAKTGLKPKLKRLQREPAYVEIPPEDDARVAERLRQGALNAPHTGSNPVAGLENESETV